MKKFLIMLALLLLTGCTAADNHPTEPSELQTQVTVAVPETDPPTLPPTEPPTDPIEEIVKSMTTEEKVGQLFLARYDSVNAPDHVRKYHLGGWILFGADFKEHTPETIRSQIDALQDASALPMLIAVDEEGGSVTRISRYPAYRESKFPSPRSLYAAGGLTHLLDTEAEKCRLLTAVGMNVNVGPVCDITTDPYAFMYDRSLGLEPDAAGAAIAGMVKTMSDNGIGSVLKHFPGYGNNADTHVGIARDSRSLEELEACDLVPFRSGIEAGCDAILVSHTIVEALDDTLPASLSPAVIAYLRSEMGFDGVVITDDLVMQAITDTYGAGEAAVLAVLAGNDLLCASEYVTQYEAVLAAVSGGRIPMERIDDAVIRVLKWKLELGLIEFDR